MTAVRVRPGTGLDEDAAVAVWQAAQAGRGRRSGGTRAQRVRAQLRSPDALLLVGERDDAGVGVLLARLAAGGVLEVALLAVLPAAQRTGVARALLAALLERYPRVRAEVEADDAPALALYASAGFVPDTSAEGPGVLLRSPS